MTSIQIFAVPIWGYRPCSLGSPLCREHPVHRSRAPSDRGRACLRRDRISSLRLSYRHPNVLPECALDVMAGIAYLTHGHAQPVVLVGHPFGGAVVITAGALHAHVAGVVALAPQTSGATLAGKLA